MSNREIKLVILDVDGVLTDGKKYYDNSGTAVLKTFCDRDFTAIKKFKSFGVNVVFLSGDENINKKIAENRNIDFYHSRGECKSSFLEIFKEQYNCTENQIVFIGDDIFDLQLMKKVRWKFCPSNADLELHKICAVLKSPSGNNCISELYDYLSNLGLVYKDVLEELDIEKIYNLDSYEKF